MNSIKKTARMAGLFYLLFIAAMVFAGLFGHFAFDDATATVNHITANEGLFRIGFVCDLLSAVLFLLAAWALYVLLKPVNKNMALLFLLLNLGGVALQCCSDVGLIAGLQYLSGADYLNVFPQTELQAQATMFISLHKSVFDMAQLFYGVWLLPLGYLVYKSGFLPRILGILLIMDFIAVLIWFFQSFLFPGYEAILTPCWVISFIAEVGLGLWLVIKGVKNEKADMNEGGRNGNPDHR